MRLKRKKEGEEKDGSFFVGGREGNKILLVEFVVVEMIKFGYWRYGGMVVYIFFFYF